MAAPLGLLLTAECRRRINGPKKQLEVDAAEIRMRAERQLGEMIRDQWATTGKASGRPKISAGKELIKKPTLASVAEPITHLGMQASLPL